MYNREDIFNRDIKKEQFDYVQKDKKIYDQIIQGKPIGYLQDVWIRFRKNRANLFASMILLTLIICAIIMPGLSGKEYIKLDEKLSFLPPRIPILEDFGIADGTIEIENMPVDMNLLDEETGLYYPKDFDENALLKDTLTNRTVTSVDKSPNVLGGESILRLDFDSETMTIETNEFYTLSKANNGYVEVDIFEMPANSKFEVLAQIDFGGEPSVIGTITEAGKHQIKIFEDNEELYADIVSKIGLRFVSEEPGTVAAVKSIASYDDSSTEPLIFDEGYELSSFIIVGGKGAYQRQNGQLIEASFKYNKYISAFGETHEIAFSSSEYDALLEEWGSKVKKIPNPDNPDGWFFSEGFPIREVIKKNDEVVVDGESYSSYEVKLNYAAYLGYSELPYYLFGTTYAGRDLFSLVWVGLRTSLYIGFVVTIINVSIGIVYGSISGFYGGLVDLLMQRFAELMGRIPWLVTLSIMVVLFDPGIKTLILMLIISGWIGTAGVTRMQFYRYKGREYVLASKTLGAKDSRLIFRHILPNGIGTIITSSVLAIPGVIFTEAALSFLGYGIGHGQSFNIFAFTFSGVSIGVLLSDARAFLTNYPYLTIFPATIVSILMITFNMFGNALRDAFNPSLRGVED
jgi:ABC-type dipeptide/oligopeptide/nickel transport system permease subunit